MSTLNSLECSTISRFESRRTSCCSSVLGPSARGVCRRLDPEFDFLSATQSFLVDHGFVESELKALLNDGRTDIRKSVPVLAGLPAQVDSDTGQLQRGELVVRTEPIDRPTDSGLGYAVLASAFVVAAALLVSDARAYALGSFAVAVVFALQFHRVIARRGRIRRQPRCDRHADHPRFVMKIARRGRSAIRFPLGSNFDPVRETGESAEKPNKEPSEEGIVVVKNRAV